MKRREVRPVQDFDERLLPCLCAVLESGEHDVQWQSLKERTPLLVPIRFNLLWDKCYEIVAVVRFNNLWNEFWCSLLSFAHWCFSFSFEVHQEPKTEKPPSTSGGYES